MDTGWVGGQGWNGTSGQEKLLIFPSKEEAQWYIDLFSVILRSGPFSLVFLRLLASSIVMCLDLVLHHGSLVEIVLVESRKEERGVTCSGALGPAS
jgi:hypothetical protein